MPVDETSVAAAPTPTTPEIAHWLGRWMVVAVIVMSVLRVVTAFADEMPASHHLPAVLATAVLAGAWALELRGLLRPRFTLIAATVLPNVWLALIGHTSANNLFLLLLVAWVGIVGTRAESLTAL